MLPVASRWTESLVDRPTERYCTVLNAQHVCFLRHNIASAKWKISRTVELSGAPRRQRRTLLRGTRDGIHKSSPRFQASLGAPCSLALLLKHGLSTRLPTMTVLRAVPRAQPLIHPQCD